MFASLSFRYYGAFCFILITLREDADALALDGATVEADFFVSVQLCFVMRF